MTFLIQVRKHKQAEYTMYIYASFIDTEFSIGFPPRGSISLIGMLNLREQARDTKRLIHGES